jgi:hypothetical protein
VLDADIRDYFDTLELKQAQQHAISNPPSKNVLQVIGKWLHAGVVADGVLRTRKRGLPREG